MGRDFVTVEEAITLPGLRIAFTQGVPGPWGQAVREIFDMKGLEYTPVIQEGGGANEALRQWTGQNSAPCAVLANERPRTHWSELILLAERLAPEPRLVPVDQDDRTLMFGLLYELCGEDGFGWSTRLLILDMMEKAGAADIAAGMRRKFASGSPLEHAVQRIIAVMAGLTRQLERQRDRGSRYFVGDSLSAADIYWTTFSNMVAPMDDAVCPMPDYYRTWTNACIAATETEVPAILIAHRDFIVDRHLSPPMYF